MFYEVGLHKHHAGVGMWQAGEANGEGWVNAEDLVDEIARNVYEIVELGGPDPLEDGVEDIRGRIYDEPARIFAFRRDADAEDIEYVGIIERDT